MIGYSIDAGTALRAAIQHPELVILSECSSESGRFATNPAKLYDQGNASGRMGGTYAR